MIEELSWHNLKPVLMIDGNEHPLDIGHDISIYLSDERRCIGYKEFGVGYGGLGKPQLTPCPSHEKITPGGKDAQCEFCRQKDITAAAKTGYGMSAAATKLFTADHAVYLAYFSDSTIKVGVALWERREVRTTEQGAIACLIVAKASGTAARDLERTIRLRVGLTEWVQVTKKLQELCASQPSEVKARQALMKAHKRVLELAPSTNLLAEPEFRYLLPRYKLDDSIFESTILYTKEINGGAKIGGKLLGVCGKVLFVGLGDDNKVLAVNSGLLSGYSCQGKIVPAGEYSGVVTKDLNIDRQQNLFDMLA